MDPIFFGNKELSDVVLNVADHDFHAHKMMLSNHSEYFYKLFYNGIDQVLRTRFVIGDISPKTFKRLLQFIYNGEIDDADNFMPCCSVCKTSAGSKKTGELLRVAERFQMMKRLKNYIIKMINKNACNKGCVECFDGFVFSCAHKLDIIQRKKKYCVTNIKVWCETKANNVPRAQQMDVIQLYTLLHSVSRSC